jgi:hypothetical protein
MVSLINVLVLIDLVVYSYEDVEEKRGSSLLC